MKKARDIALRMDPESPTLRPGWAAGAMVFLRPEDLQAHRANIQEMAATWQPPRRGINRVFVSEELKDWVYKVIMKKRRVKKRGHQEGKHKCVVHDSWLVPAPKPQSAPKTPMRWADMLSDDEDDEPLSVPVQCTPAPAATTAPAAPASDVVELAEEAQEDSATSSKKRRTHRGGRSAVKRAEQEQRKLAKKEVVAVAALPDVVLARVFEYVDLAAVGAAACTGRAMRAAVWDSAAFWTHLASDGSISSADGFRKWLFGLQGDWAAAFHAYCTTADPATALGEAAYLAGGLMRSDTQEMGAFVAAVVCAAQRVESDWDA